MQAQARALVQVARMGMGKRRRRLVRLRIRIHSSSSWHRHNTRNSSLSRLSMLTTSIKTRVIVSHRRLVVQQVLHHLLARPPIVTKEVEVEESAKQPQWRARHGLAVQR